MLAEITNAVAIPAVAIGGIKLDYISQLRKMNIAGVSRTMYI